MKESVPQHIQKVSFITIFLILTVSGILSFTLLNILFPLALYSIVEKILCIGISFLCTFAGLILCYQHYIRFLVPQLKNNWIPTLIIAVFMTCLILFVLPRHLPYRPVTHAVTIESNTSSFGTRWVETEQGQYITVQELLLIGTWDVQEEIAYYTGKGNAAFRFENTEFTRDKRSYTFGFFVDESTSTSFTITVDGKVMETVKISTENIENGVFEYHFNAPLKASSSQLWQWVSTIFLITNGLSILILLFFGINFILNKDQSILFHILQIILTGMILYLYWMSLSFQSELLNFLTQTITLPLLTSIVILLIPLLMCQWLKRNPHRSSLFLALVLLLTVGIRIYWIVMVPTAQVSDFGRFHNWALQLASGEPGLWIDRYANFTRALSLLYRIFPSHVAMEVVNILAAAGTALCLYFLGKIHQHENIGLIAAYLLALYPPHIALTSTVNTDILSAFLLTLSVFLLILSLHKSKRALLVLSSVIFGVCFFLRGAMLIYFPVLIFTLFLQKKQKTRTILIQIALILTFFLSTVFTLNSLIEWVKVEDLVIDESRYLMWPLVNGTNVDALGRNNPEDTKMLFSWPPEEVNRLGLEVLKERLFSHPLDFLSILDDKFEHLLADATYSAETAFLDETHEYHTFQTGWKAPTLQVREIFAQLSQYAYLIILLLALIAVVKTDHRQATLWVPSLVILLCALGGYTFFEVQPRYSFPLIPFFILLAAMVFTEKESAQTES